MTDQMRRRGPDGEGLTHRGDAVLGHRRLAILDLSERGAQPMLSQDGSVAVVFNGAIYNFRELRVALEKSGFIFRSQTDTEVLVNGYRAWGIHALVASLRGMFAFAVWDNRSSELYLVRDRLGVKPLLYAVRDDEIGFASTARALRAAGFGTDLNAQAVADFLEWGFVPEQSCIYGGIEKLQPGTILRWCSGRVSLTQYWEPPRAGSVRISFEDAVQETERLLVQAVSRRTVADVPIGALLSGGIDSALVCWGLRECGADVQAFTFAAPGHPQDESADALATAAELGISPQVLQRPLASEWDDLADAYAEPFACASAIGMLSLSKAVRDSATVLLTGDGGDDVFLGYRQHRYLRVAQKLGTLLPPQAAELFVRAGQMPPLSGPLRGARQFASYAAAGLPAFLSVRSNFRYLQQSSLLGDQLADLLPSSQSLPVRPYGGKTVLDDYLHYDRRHQFVAEYLTKVDGATMHHSLEARSPFLDQDLWEFAAALPYEIRLRGGRQKAILREIARRRISPRVAAGRKRGFEVPVEKWLKTEWAAGAHRLLTRANLRNAGLVDSANLWAEFERGQTPTAVLWYVCVLAQWMEKERTLSASALTSGAEV